ncbi:MAG: hypothetical protein AAFP00_11460 [Bacteroidota bacterium]
MKNFLVPQLARKFFFRDSAGDLVQILRGKATQSLETYIWAAIDVIPVLKPLNGWPRIQLAN